MLLQKHVSDFVSGENLPFNFVDIQRNNRAIYWYIVFMIHLLYLVTFIATISGEVIRRQKMSPGGNLFADHIKPSNGSEGK